MEVTPITQAKEMPRMSGSRRFHCAASAAASASATKAPMITKPGRPDSAANCA